MAYTIKERLENELREIRDAGLYKEERVIVSPQGAHIKVGKDDVICMCANNYLGLSSDPELIQAAHKTLDEHGLGMSSVRFICGTQDIHRELERKMSAFLGTEDTILFPSCLDANAGVFEAVLGSEDVIIADRLIHASLVDGIRLCAAEYDTFKHMNMRHLEKKRHEILQMSLLKPKIAILDETDSGLDVDGIDSGTVGVAHTDTLLAMSKLVRAGNISGPGIPPDIAHEHTDHVGQYGRRKTSNNCLECNWPKHSGVNKKVHN